MRAGAPGVVFHDFEPATESFRAAVLDGLAMPQKSIPSRFFYDAEGSRLFEQICTLPEYYPTRTELALLRAHREDLAARLGRNYAIVEFGCGSSAKVRMLLDATPAPKAYLAIDISRTALLRLVDELAPAYPDIAIQAICADYTRFDRLPEGRWAEDTRLVGFYPGSTIGNFTPDEAARFLGWVAGILGPGGALIVGIDLFKPKRLLEAAYNDTAGVTAAFNLNLLTRINRELDGDFDLQQFRHTAFFNADESRVEMHLESLCAQTVRVAGKTFSFAAGETIHTENSYKYTAPAFARLAARAGFTVDQTWIDKDGLFSLHYLRHI